MDTRDTTRVRAEHLGPERRRPAVLDSALAIAVERGVGAVTMVAVAERAGVTRPVIYACFPDRVALIEALVRREEEYIIGGVIDALPERSIRPDRSVFVDGFRRLLVIVSARPDSWRLVFDAHPDPAVAAMFGRGRHVAIERCTRLLRPTLHAWNTEDADRKLPVLADLWVSSSESAVRMLLSPDATWNIDELGDLMGGALYRAIRRA